MNVSLLDDENYLEQLRINIAKWKLEGVLKCLTNAEFGTGSNTIRITRY